MSLDVAAIPTERDLLAEYRTGTAFFASPRHTLLAEGAVTTVAPASGADELADLPVRVVAALRAAAEAGHESPVVIGAVPFDHGQPAHLVVPHRFRRTEPISVNMSIVDDRAPALDFDVRPVPEPEAHLSAVARAVARMRSGEFEKVVLARS
ncbi:hypothetical protein SAMN05444320_1111, partial [Streptoalloteichus hindustanus]